MEISENLQIGKLVCKIVGGRWVKKIEVVGKKILVCKIGVKNSKEKIMIKKRRNCIKFLKAALTVI